MSCRIIISPVTNKEETSILWNEIRDIVASDEQADVAYSNVVTEEFVEVFGNWVEEPESIDKSKVNSIGEPLLTEEVRSFIGINSTIVKGPINYYDEPGFKKRNPNFNPETYVNTVNKFGESKKEFPELTPTLNEVKPGVEEIFNNNPELAEIGSVMDYQEYLDSIFPFSKVKDIVSHNSPNKFEKFNVNRGRLGVGVYFGLGYKIYNTGQYNYNALLNITNLKRYDKGEFVITANRLYPSKDEYSTKPQDTLKSADEASGVNGYVSTSPVGTEFLVFNPEQIHILGSKQDIEGFKEFVQGKQFDEGEVSYVLKSLSILQSTKAQELFEKGYKNNWSLDKILTELQIPKEQKQIILDSGKNSREEIITDLLANYSYTIEINTAKEGTNYFTEERTNHKTGETYYPILEEKTNKEITRFGNEEAAAKYLNKIYYNNTQYYSNLTVPGGTNYTENEIATPAITPSIKGHAQFISNDNNIGWFRSDERQNYTEQDIDILIDNMIESGVLKIKCS